MSGGVRFGAQGGRGETLMADGAQVESTVYSPCVCRISLISVRFDTVKEYYYASQAIKRNHKVLFVKRLLTR